MSGAETLHASAVAIAGQGLLILGASGTGKSALALALVARGARLVADDRTVVTPGSPLAISAPVEIAGLVEARGIGLIRVPYQASAPLKLAVDLDQRSPARLPAATVMRLHDTAVPLIMGRDRPGLADTLYVLLSHGHLINPDGRDPGHESAE